MAQAPTCPNFRGSRIAGTTENCMEGMHGAAYARAPRIMFKTALLAGLVTIALAACSSAADKPQSTPIPTFTQQTGAASPSVPAPTSAVATNEIPDAPMTTSAVAVSKPQRGVDAPVGAIVFGSDCKVATHSVSLVDQQTTFAAGADVAWRVTLPTATGGESVRVTLTTESNTETVVDQFVAQAGWNVYYGKSLLTAVPGMYVLHYLVDGHELGSGTFEISACLATALPAPSSSPTTQPTPAATPTPTKTPTQTPTPQPTKEPKS